MVYILTIIAYSLNFRVIKLFYLTAVINLLALHENEIYC